MSDDDLKKNKNEEDKVETLSDSAIQLDEDEDANDEDGDGDDDRPSEPETSEERNLDVPIPSHLPPWLGTGLFWILAAVAMVISFGILLVKHRNVFESSAVVPVLTITGPSRAAAGETVRYAVLVRDRHGAPIASAPVRLGFYKRGFIELGTANTADSGEATIAIKMPDDFAEPRTVVGIADVGVAEGYDSVPIEPKKIGLGSMFVSTDKPMYQPSQTIHIRALAMAGEKPMGSRNAIIEVRTGDGIKVFREEKPTTDFGIVSVDFPLAEQVKLGFYTITVTIKSVSDKDTQPNVVGTRQVEVKRYSLPKLKVALEDVSPIGVEGLKGKAHATWIFGEPVVRGKVTLEVIGWTQAATSKVEGITDKNGIFAFDFPWRTDIKTQSRQHGTFTLKAKVAVEGGMANETSTSIATLDGGDLKLEAFAEGGVLLEDIEQDVFVVVSSREAQENVTVRTKDAPPGTGAKVSARGIAKVRVRAPKPFKPNDAPWKFLLVAEGDRGSEGKLEITPSRNRLLVRSDRDAYNAGDTAKVTVLGGLAGDRIAARLTKGSEPVALGSCLVQDAVKGCEVALPITKETAGLVWLHAMSLPVGKRVAGADGVIPASDVLTGKRLVIVAGGGRDLGIKATPDKPVFAPRDNGSVDVAVSNSTGAPVKAQLGVAVADEAIFALADVRPDLEKIFFTIDKDLEKTRRGYSYSSYSYSSRGGHFSEMSEQRLPSGLEASAAYDPATEPDVRSAILTVLTTMPETGGSSVASSSELASRAAQAATDRGKRIAAWGIVLVGIWALIAFIGFAMFGWSRIRHPDVPFATPEDVERFKVETRALYIDWLIACLAPIGLMAGIIAANAVLGFTRSPTEGGLFGAWLVAGGFLAVMLIRALLRVRKTAIARRSPPLVRILVFLPVAAFLAHLAVVLSFVDAGNRLEYIFGSSAKGGMFIVPTAIAIFAQLTCGFLSIIRQTLLRPVSRKGRVWLFMSRASFVGLPLTLAFAVFLVYEWRRVAARSTWHDFIELAQERDYRDRGGGSETTESDGVMKEGGTGTRAKGEEGSMGNPSPAFNRPGGSGAAAPSARFAALDDEGEKSAKSISVGGPIVRTRDYFPETLLWAPEVITDDAGHAKISVPFADSITTWRFGLRAVSKEGQLGSLTIPLVVKQDFFVDAHLPPVLTQGDEVAMPVTVYSYLPEEQDVGIEIEGEGITAVGGQRNSMHFAPKEARGFRFTIRADRAGDRTVKIKATGKTRGDALERKIKVIPNGREVVRTINGRLVESTSEDIDLPPNGIDGGNDLYMKIYGGPLSQVSEGLDGVFTMPHGCFEQTSSVTYPSILALDFLQRSKTASPEIEKRAKQYIVDGYQRLISFEVSTNGGFSLFGKSPASTILSAYGLLELSDMSRVTPIVDEMILRRTRTWLYNNRSKEGGWAKIAPTQDPSFLNAPPPGAANKKPEPDDDLVTAYVAWAVAAMSALPGEPKDDKLASVLDGVVKMKGAKADDVYGLALRANALIAGGRVADAKPLLERLAASAVKGDDGVHWTSTETGVMYSAGESMNIEVTGLASHALSRAEMHPDLRNGALSWLVSRRNYSGVWSTTQATIAAMRALLAEAKPAPKEPQDVLITVDGEAAGNVRLEPGGRDVHHLVNLRKWSTSGRHQVEAKATGSADIGFQLVTQHYLPWQKQAPGKPSPLTMEVAYAPQTVQAGTETTCKVRVAWKGKEPARMPLIEIGVPPAFEVDSADLDKIISSQDAQVKRYGIERGKVTLYLDTLAEDKPLTLDLPMRALRPARVVTPSSSSYLYYEPEVHADTQPVVVRSL